MTGGRTPGSRLGPDRPLARAMGIVGLTGSFALLASNIAGSMVVPNYDWVADTVSDLAAGRYEIIQDLGLYAFAAALFACSIGAAHDHGGGRRWSLGIVALALLAACVTVIAARNEYGDSDSEGIVVHIYVVYLLGALFAALFWLMAEGLGRVAPWLRWFSLACAVLWTLTAVAFFSVPTSIDGLFERLVGLVSLAWVCVFSWVLIARDRDLG